MSPKLSFEQRERANALLEDILEQPEKYAHELIALRDQLEAQEIDLEQQRSHAYVWAGADPFTGAQVEDLLNENDSLRARVKELERALNANGIRY